MIVSGKRNMQWISAVRDYHLTKNCRSDWWWQQRVRASWSAESDEARNVFGDDSTMIGEALEVGSDSRYQCSTSRTIASGVETVRQTTEGPERSSPGNSESPTDSGSGDPCEAALTTITFKHPAER
ncbi:unnamed protein product [Acanthoscelides obtectus]|uniref:Uncharacterized protein n=1 Tax=Acanthoscelides obtectus TaxID=200917 RepID=A0A9P0VUM9_ACAOB|nr:unnamed protein product [Acanthoscelides obtectus]CAK1684674.1 hypothetical protein AOBTE_LOCUS35020 [Acanthoscelides obtectus]